MTSEPTTTKLADIRNELPDGISIEDTPELKVSHPHKGKTEDNESSFSHEVWSVVSSCLILASIVLFLSTTFLVKGDPAYRTNGLLVSVYLLLLAFYLKPGRNN